VILAFDVRQETAHGVDVRGVPRALRLTRVVRQAAGLDTPAPLGIQRFQAFDAAGLVRRGTTERLVVPHSAVVRENDSDYVFLALPDNQFRLTRVKLGQSSNGHRVVLDGLKAGETIVVEGAFHLNNQRNSEEAE